MTRGMVKEVIRRCEGGVGGGRRCWSGGCAGSRTRSCSQAVPHGGGDEWVVDVETAVLFLEADAGGTASACKSTRRAVSGAPAWPAMPGCRAAWRKQRGVPVNWQSWRRIGAFHGGGLCSDSRAGPGLSRGEKTREPRKGRVIRLACEAMSVDVRPMMYTAMLGDGYDTEERSDGGGAARCKPKSGCASDAVEGVERTGVDGAVCQPCFADPASRQKKSGVNERLLASAASLHIISREARGTGDCR